MLLPTSDYFLPFDQDVFKKKLRLEQSINKVILGESSTGNEQDTPGADR